MNSDQHTRATTRVQPPVSLLLILDGFGYRTEIEGNAIMQAKTPNLDRLWQSCPHTLLAASGEAVGLPAGQMGNSEVGHLHIGAGRLVRQELTRIDYAIESGQLAQNATLNKVLEAVQATGKRLHLMGLLSDGGVHSHIKHWQALLAIAAQRGLRQLALHLFLDGRDTPPQSAASYIQTIETDLAQLGCGRIASISGRFWAMDRDQRWDRIARTYNLLIGGQSEQHASSALAALQASYDRGEFDEFVQPTIIDGMNADTEFQPIADGDWVLFVNFRADRARELCSALTIPDASFTGFTRTRQVALGGLATMTQYADTLPAEVLFPPQQIHNGLGEVVASAGLAQLRLAETEKYAHVTYFINGGQEACWPGEARILVPSPKVATYDLQPQMSALEVTEQLLNAIAGQQYPLIICNFANPDMVGHTGKLPETIAAIEFLDLQLGRIVEQLTRVHGQMLLIADHGNAEIMINPATGAPHTAHTTNPVPCIYCGATGRNLQISQQHLMQLPNERTGYSLADVAPTMLFLLGLQLPAEMTGVSIVEESNL